jgi:hypothetical protein
MSFKKNIRIVQKMPYKLVAGQGGYFVVSPHGHRLSSHPLTKEQAMKQETAVRLTEMRKEGKMPEKADPKHHPEQSHTHHLGHHLDGQQHHKFDAEGLLFVPVSRDMVHKHQIIPTRDIFAPLPLPAHFNHKNLEYANTGM